MEYQDKYLQVDPDFEELVIELAKEGKNGKVHFFDPKDQIMDAQGILKLKHTSEASFLEFPELLVRLDKIITVLGKPGPAYDQYDRYANACLACEDLGQFY